MKKYLPISLIIVVLTAGVAYFGFKFYNGISPISPKACTQEAKQCPDGSYVSRVGPNCEFAECPSGEEVVDTSKTWTVEYIDNRYVSSEIKIKKGDTVMWINRSERSTWPASAFHPTHQVYPGFDALKGLGKGESYSFTFDRVGSWKYHDHLNT